MVFDLVFYQKILEMAQERGYQFCAFTDNHSNMILLRHDIDISPSLALKMAETEYKMGIKSTYFFMIRSPFYNLFSRANDTIVRKIISMGHMVGLHFDEGYYSKSVGLQTLIDEEIKMMESNFDINIDTVSFHQPSQKIIQNEITIRQINTYDQEYFREMKYLSDSNMILKEDPINMFENKMFDKIQLLIHPIWWSINGSSTEEKFVNAIKLNFELEQQQILATERAYGEKKIMRLEKN